MERVDDYAWLAAADDPEVAAHLLAERSYYDAATAHLGSLRLGLARDMIRRTPPAERSVSWRRGGYLYYTLAVEGEEYERIYRTDIVSEQTLLVLDPNALAAGHDYLELGLCEPSPDGRLLAYSLDLTGEEVYELRFRDLSSGADLPDRVPRTYYGGAWSADSGSFCYTVPDAAYRPDRVLRHVLGTACSADELVHQEADRRFELEVAASRDGRWTIITAASRDTTEVVLLDADVPRTVAARRPGVEYRVEPLPGGWAGAGDDRLLLVTDDGAPEFRLVTAPVPAPGAVGDPSGWTPVQPSIEDGERLVRAVALASWVVLEVRRDTEPFLRILPRAGAGPVREVRCSLPFGQLRLGRAEHYAATAITVVEENLVTPPAWYEVDLATGARRLLKRTEVPGADLTRYATSRIETATGVPITIAHPAGAPPQTPAPGVLYGYGAYESCEWPAFDVATLSLLDRGAIYALAHVRGGGERGRAWWQAGRLRAKQRTFDDFVAARDALVAAGWLAADRVVSRGLSAGGLLQAAVFSQAPDRWRGVVAEVPFVDVVTTMSDPAIPLTVNEWEEWGNPLDSAADFHAMLAYSPYDNPPPAGGRPALLVTGAVNDPRVLVHEPAKWVALLRATDPAARAPGSADVLFRVELGGGAHVGPSGRQARFGYQAEILAWILDRLGLAG